MEAFFWFILLAVAGLAFLAGLASGWVARGEREADKAKLRMAALRAVVPQPRSFYPGGGPG